MMSGQFGVVAGSAGPWVVCVGPSFRSPPPATDAFDALAVFHQRGGRRCAEFRGPVGATKKLRDRRACRARSSSRMQNALTRAIHDRIPLVLDKADIWP